MSEEINDFLYFFNNYYHRISALYKKVLTPRRGMIMMEELKNRVKRCKYLYNMAIKMNQCGNVEQAEAYIDRINMHKPIIIELVSKCSEHIDEEGKYRGP